MSDLETGANDTGASSVMARQLTAQAKALWGERRTAELRGPLEDTARLLTELRERIPDRNVEPGFYP